jgi:acyl-CoA synthetase (AMP-forming)/AMP-acid ligase II
MTYQVLHNPELQKLDLSSLAYATAGAAHLPPELRVAFERRAKNLPFFFEGSDFPCHPCIALICNLIGYGLSECVCLADCLSIHGAKQVYLRPTQLSCSPSQERVGGA